MYILTDFDPAQENWFWVDVLDIYGLSTLSGGMTNEIDDAPTSSDVYPISHNDEFQIMWSKNNGIHSTFWTLNLTLKKNEMS